MNKAFKIIGILGVIVLSGCAYNKAEQTEEVVTKSVPVELPSHVIKGTLAQARQNPDDRLFACYYEINGRVSKAYPKRMKTCPATIYINTKTNDVTFGR